MRKGFTLIELLVVIAIIAVLSVVVVLVLNPAELLRQSRDANRISDLATLKNVASLYLEDVSNGFLGTSTVADFSTAGTSTFVSASSSWGMATALSGTALATTSRAINGTGWLPLNLTLLTSGPPIGSLPIDPINASSSALTGASGTFYGYIPRSGSTTFKVVTHMESSKYGFGGSNPVVVNDAGVSTTTYEQGTDLSL